MSRLAWRGGDRRPADRVAPVEIFFDLVFVFTLTQLTRILEADLSLPSLGRVLLLFGILWWMVTGYVWLPNSVPPRRATQKLLLFAGMAGFLVAAVGVPEAFGRTGLVFGVGYLVVICVHLLLFTQAGIGIALLWLAVYNVGSALLVVFGGLADGAVRYELWLAAFALQSVVPYLVPRLSWVSVIASFHIAARHFVERHGLLLIVALGESVVAIGISVDVAHLTAGTVAVTVAALALPFALWWTYFTETGATEAALERAERGPRARLALRIGFTHIPLLLGIVVAAAGIHSVVAHPGEPASVHAALALAGGVALYLAGIAVARQSLHVPVWWSRWVGAGVVLGTVPLGTVVSAWLQLVAVIAVIVAMLALTGHRNRASTEGVGAV
ncbi:low temperature requirement protein A [Micromonosporaceae bacterium B7E4]